ncbi:MAG: hypothetical protein AB2L20_05185 [Mangrovibacterium sp.]
MGGIQNSGIDSSTEGIPRELPEIAQAPEDNVVSTSPIKPPERPALKLKKSLNGA